MLTRSMAHSCLLREWITNWVSVTWVTHCVSVLHCYYLGVWYIGGSDSVALGSPVNPQLLPASKWLPGRYLLTYKIRSFYVNSIAKPEAYFQDNPWCTNRQGNSIGDLPLFGVISRSMTRESYKVRLTRAVTVCLPLLCDWKWLSAPDALATESRSCMFYFFQMAQILEGEIFAR